MNARFLFPYSAPFDSIEPCTGTLGDLTYIDAPMPKTTGALMKALPFQGAGGIHFPRHSGYYTLGKSLGKVAHTR